MEKRWLEVKGPQKRKDKLEGSIVFDPTVLKEAPGSNFSIGDQVWVLYGRTITYVGQIVKIIYMAEVSKKKDILIFQKMVCQKDPNIWSRITIGYRTGYPWKHCFHSEEEAKQYIEDVKSGKIKDKQIRI